MRILHRLGKKLFFGRFQRLWRWPENVPEEGWERVTIQRDGGTKLAAVFGAASGAVRGAVVLAHPMTVAAKGFWLRQGHAELLRSSGFHVLAFDFNGFGESDSIDFDYPGDVLAAGEYLKRRIAPLPIGVLGCSFGAGYALCAMAEEGHPFRAAILEAAFPSLPFYWRRYPLPHLLLRASQLVYPRFERRLRPIRAASELKGLPRILLVQGTRDSITPVTVGEELRNAMTGHESVALWIAEEAEHNHALRAQPAGYAERVIPFLRNAFDVASRTPPAPRTAAYNHQRSS